MAVYTLLKPTEVLAVLRNAMIEEFGKKHSITIAELRAATISRLIDNSIDSFSRKKPRIWFSGYQLWKWLLFLVVYKFNISVWTDIKDILSGITID